MRNCLKNHKPTECIVLDRPDIQIKLEDKEVKYGESTN